MTIVRRGGGAIGSPETLRGTATSLESLVVNEEGKEWVRARAAEQTLFIVWYHIGARGELLGEGQCAATASVAPYFSPCVIQVCSTGGLVRSGHNNHLLYTVRFQVIEIGSRASVGRFLNPREKSGERSVDFYFLQ